MASGYVRQSAASISSGQPVASAPVNNEYNALVSAFSGTTGHDHSGGTGLGPVLLSNSFGVTTSTAGIVNALGSGGSPAGELSTVTITGTALQIDVANGTGAAGNPTISIDTGYVGQTSITTLGTVTTGTWDATPVGTQYGGTGANLSASTGLVGISSGVISIGIAGPTYGGTGVNNGANSLTLGGSVIFSGANSVTFTSTAPTSLTLPTGGTLVNSAVSALTSLVSVGTITSGVWQGTLVGSTYGGTGVNNGSNTLTLGGSVTYSGSNSVTWTTTGTTTLTLPTSGTLVNTAVTSLSSLSTVGTIGTGVWQGTPVGVTYGGTGISLAATGGTSNVLQQTTVGGNVTVGQLAASNLSNGVTGSGAVMLNSAPSLAATPAQGNSGLLVATTAFVNQNSLGGYINKFRNGTFDIWQRATSGTITAGSPAYTADGWIISCTTANVAWARATVNSNGCYYGMRITGATGVTDTYIKQRIESYLAQQLCYGGSNVTVQFTVTNATGATLTPTLTINHAGAQDNWTSPVTDVNAVSLSPILNTGTTIVSYTFTPNASSYLGLEIILDFGAALNSVSNTVTISTADIRQTPGVATGITTVPPLVEFRPIWTELAFCQRYLWAYNAPSGSTVGMKGFMRGTGSGTFEGTIDFPVNMRTSPTGITIDNVAHFQITGIAPFSGLSFADATPYSLHVTGALAGGLTASSVYVWSSNSSAAQILVTGCEL